MSNVLSVSHLKQEFGDRVLFSDITFELDERCRLAVVGPNGCGKSTLLNIIAGVMEPVDGRVIPAKDVTIGYLEQYQKDDVSFSDIHSYVLSIRSDILEMESRLHELEKNMEQTGDALESVMEEYHSLSHQFDMMGGRSYRSEVIGVLKGLGFFEQDLSKSMDELSGGQKTRVNLARLLLMKPDILLLDEPINHLDMASIEWLEGFLSSYKKGIIIVAHDRYFLNKVVTAVLDIGSKHAKLYHGNYSSFVEQKDLLTRSYEKSYEKQQKEIAHQEEVIRKLKSFNREKSVKRAESREKKLFRMEKMEAPEGSREEMRLTLKPDHDSGKDVLFVEGLTKSFEGKTLFSDLDFHIQKGEKVALIGDNGCGKTTILKIINEVIPSDFGHIRIGSNVSIAYFDQEQQNLDEQKTLFEELSDAYSDLTETKIRNVLAAFLFKSDDAYKKISELSGGERGRVSLCKLMLSGANFLILDEPTNHLDMESKEILGRALLSYTGTVFYVSHDRYFINQTAERILELTKSFGLREFLGNYDYYHEKCQQLDRIPEATGETKSVESASNKEDWIRRKEETAKIRKLENTRKKLEEEIELLETKVEEINKLFLDETIAQNSFKLNELTTEQKKLEDKLSVLYEEWESLVS